MAQTSSDASTGSAIGSADRIILSRESDVQLGPIRVAAKLRRLRHTNGREVVLEPRAMQVLLAFLRRPGEVLSRDALCEWCWNGTVVGDDAINRAVSRLRTAVADLASGTFYIETVARVGHRLVLEQGVSRGYLSDASETKAAAKSGRGHVYTLAVLFLFVAATAAWFLIGRSSPADAVERSVAVLPFRSASPDDRFFAEGLAEEIGFDLGRGSGIRLVGPHSSAAMKVVEDPREAGRRLGVAYIVTGNIRRSRESMRIAVALISVSDGTQLWRQNWDLSTSELFVAQTEIAAAIGRRLRSDIGTARRGADPLSTTGDVYNLYVTARGLMRERTPAKLETAVTLLRRAVSLDPNYAPAWASLGSAVKMAWWYGGRADGHPAPTAEALRYATRALALAPDLAEGHAALATINDYRPSSLPHIEAAVRLNPSDAEAWYWLYTTRRNALDFEGALEAIRRTASIEPFWVHSGWAPIFAWDMGLRDEALQYWRRTAGQDPDFFHRETARWAMANWSGDLSTAYRRAQAAASISGADMRQFADRRSRAILLRLGLLDELGSLTDNDRFFVALARGETPSDAALQARFPSALDYWSTEETRLLLPRLLLNGGRSDDLVRLYDRAFASPGAMARSHPGGAEAFVADAPAMALALRRAGRASEGEALLRIADRLIQRAQRLGRLPGSFRADAARVWALLGRDAAALEALEQAVAQGWRQQEASVLPRLQDDPALSPIRTHPRLLRLDAMLEGELDRERSELRASGI